MEHSELDDINNNSIQQTESDIIKGCCNGNIRAQEQLYRNYYNAMMQLCLRYTKNENDATEVLNTGFLKIFLNIQRYEPAQASLYTWIRTIVINSCIDFIKQKIKSEKHYELEKATEVQIDAVVINKMEVSALLYLIRQLTPSTQAVFNLYVMEGYNHKEIAKLLNISEGTSKWHLSEARKKLQKMILLQEVKI